MESYHTTPSTRFSSFQIHTTSYKRIGPHPISLAIIIPKSLVSKPSKENPRQCPLLVKFHGGGLVVGDALYPDWFAAWYVPLLHRAGAIGVLPNYRLLPEHSGAEILQDLEDLWTWVKNDLNTFLRGLGEGLEADLERVLVGGDSAGGLLALMSAFMMPEGVTLRGFLAQYPMTSYLSGTPGEMMAAFPSLGPDYIDKHLEGVEEGSVVSPSTPPDRFPLIVALSAQGRWREFYGEKKGLLPIERVEDVGAFPPTLIIHGEQDRAVNVEDSRKFVEKLKSKVPDVEVRLVTRTGDHGFDAEYREEDHIWLKENLEWIEKLWVS